jgi:hypothetical protein
MNIPLGIAPGRSARIELWGNTPPHYNPYDPNKPPMDGLMELLSAKIGCVE